MVPSHIDSLHVVLPAYLQVTATTLVSEDPVRFRASLGIHASRVHELLLSGAQYYFLTLADGAHTTAELVAIVRQEFGVEEAGDLESWIAELVDKRLLHFAETSPEVLPSRDDRYARHSLFYASLGMSGEEAQRRLAKASVAVLGVGGIGTWVSYLLAAAGIGRLRLVDGDRIELSNMTRQVLFRPSDVGKLKVEVAAERLREQRPDLVCETWAHDIAEENDLNAAVADSDMILLSGNTPPQILEWVDRFAVREKKAWLRTGYAHAQAVCGPLLVPGLTACQACVTRGRHDGYLSELPFPDAINRRFQAPSFGPVNGIAAAIAAKEIVAWLAGITVAQGAVGGMVIVDGLSLASTFYDLPRDPACPRCGHLFAKMAS
jgi:bacteriocin biosynthesis cyclodehydratase domain-containing protein